MNIIDFIISKLSSEERDYIKNKDLSDLSEHFGISMNIRNLIRKYNNELFNDREFNLEFSTIQLMWRGEMGENYVLEKIWRIFNKIEFDEKNEKDLIKIIHKSDPELLDEDVKRKLIEYINSLKK